MLNIDLKDKKAFVAGIGDDQGYGFAIAKSLAEAGAEIRVGTWPPVLGLFTKSLERGKFDASLELKDGGKLSFEKVYPLDAEFDSAEDVPESTREDKRYRELSDYSISEVAAQVKADLGNEKLDVVVHSLANGPEVKNPLLETSRKGYLSAVSSSAYSFVSMCKHFAPIMNPGGAIVALSYMASERVIPGYGGGMASAKAALEADTRYLAYEVGRSYGVRVNVISAGPLKSRAAKAIGFIDRIEEYAKRNQPLAKTMSSDDVGDSAAFLCSDLSRAITGSVVYVDNGYHIMGVPVEEQGMEGGDRTSLHTREDGPTFNFDE